MKSGVLNPWIACVTLYNKEFLVLSLLIIIKVFYSYCNKNFYSYHTKYNIFSFTK